ncbi:MAG TPA: DUF2231 domain-containing protein [Kofleriaceae bacterium]|nr:DUF2231 domain-containing protein [Kofleriaceae bacterium]
MSSQAMYSKVQLKGHPIHPMLVSFPIALYTSGVVGLIVYIATRDTFWYRASMTVLLAGAAMAALAAVPGLIDLFFGIPRNEKRARTTGVIHMCLNVASLALFAGAGFSMLMAWQHPAGTEYYLPYTLPLTLGIIGIALTGAAGYFGWKLVQTHHVGISETPQLEARTPAFEAGLP